MNDLKELLKENEDWLMERILHYASEQGYTKYASTLVEPWRLSISGLSAAIVQGFESLGGKPQEFEPDVDYTTNPLAEFGMLEARRHRERGINLGMFLGLLKYYRQSYQDLVREKVEDDALGARHGHFLIRCFDLFELALCVEWNATPEDVVIEEMQRANRDLANEKNRYLTLFESMCDPAFLLDVDCSILHFNLAGAELLGLKTDAGGAYYSDNVLESIGASEGAANQVEGKSLADFLPWIEEPLAELRRWDSGSHRREVEADYFGTKRWFNVVMTAMLDVSGKFNGTVVVATDVTMQKSIQELHETNEERLTLALDATSDGIWDWNVETGEAFFSPRYYTMLGYVPYEFEPSYQSWRDHVHPDDLEDTEKTVSEQLGKGLSFQMEFRMRTKTGQWRWIIGRGKVARLSSAGEPVRMVGTHLDFTEHRQAQAALSRREAQLRGIFDTVGSGIALLDAGGGIRRANAKLAEMLGYEDTDRLHGMNFFDLLRPDFADDVRDVFARFDMGEAGANREERMLVGYSGDELWTDQSLSVIQAEPGIPRSVVFACTDITERKRMEEEIRTLASTDSLTGVNNRRNFMKLAEVELARSRRHSRSLAMLMLDIDHFKRINDAYGHHVGDITLQKCTEVCIRTLRESDVFGRLGGEEFGAVLGETNAERAMQVAERLRQALAAIALEAEGHSLSFQVSIGVALLRKDDSDVEAVLQRADTALYQAKRTGRNKVVSSEDEQLDPGGLQDAT